MKERARTVVFVERDLRSIHGQREVRVDDSGPDVIREQHLRCGARAQAVAGWRVVEAVEPDQVGLRRRARDIDAGDDEVVLAAVAQRDAADTRRGSSLDFVASVVSFLESVPSVSSLLTTRTYCPSGRNSIAIAVPSSAPARHVR